MPRQPVLTEIASFKQIVLVLNLDRPFNKSGHLLPVHYGQEPASDVQGKKDTQEIGSDLCYFPVHKITACHLPFAGHFYQVAGQNEI